MAQISDQRGIADLHVHTEYSDGQDSPAAVLKWADRLGLDLIAITDHDTIDGALVAAEIAARTRNGPAVILGEEVSSQDGHILALFISRLIPPGMSARETVAAIHEQGGLAIAAHPFWRLDRPDRHGRAYGVGRLIEVVDFDAIEVLNGGFTPSMILANRTAAAAAASCGLATTGGSDAHVKHALGWAHTRFPGRSPFELRLSLVAGRTQAARSWIDPIGVGRYAGWSLGRLLPQPAGAG